MSPSKVHLKKSQEHMIKLIGFVLAVILLMTFVFSSSALHFNAALVSRGSIPSKARYPTKPPVLTCAASCLASLQRCNPPGGGGCNIPGGGGCNIPGGGEKNCQYLYDNCMKNCKQK